MKIAMLSYLPGKPVPPPMYGGIERMVATLTRELIRQGHEVTLIAPEGSQIEGAKVYYPAHFAQARSLIMSLKFDIVHDHSCWDLGSPVRAGFGNIPFI